MEVPDLQVNINQVLISTSGAHQVRVEPVPGPHDVIQEQRGGSPRFGDGPRPLGPKGRGVGIDCTELRPETKISENV